MTPWLVRLSNYLHTCYNLKTLAHLCLVLTVLVVVGWLGAEMGPASPYTLLYVNNATSSDAMVIKASTGDAEHGVQQRNDTALNDDGQFLVQAVTKAHYQDFATTSEVPPCRGERQNKEVEDILCIPRPDYMEDVKNPCWLDSHDRGVSLRCVPYFHVLGCSKCASTDLWARISAHPHVFDNTGVDNKEAEWWARGRYGTRGYRSIPIEDFQTYTQKFQKLTNEIASSLKAGDDRRKNFITVDATPEDMWDCRGWRDITQNRGLKLPRVLTPHLMKHIYVNPKFIIILRNPIDRQYSDFLFVNRGKSSQTFHNAVLKAIAILAACMRTRTIRECLYDNNIYQRLPTRLNYIFYSLYLMEWLKVFPRENFLFLKTEEYQQDIQVHIKTCMNFLGLESLNDTKMAEVSAKSHANLTKNKAKAGRMLPETRRILEELTRHSRLFLAELLGDEKFKWE